MGTSYFRCCCFYCCYCWYCCYTLEFVWTSVCLLLTTWLYLALYYVLFWFCYFILQKRWRYTASYLRFTAVIAIPILSRRYCQHWISYYTLESMIWPLQIINSKPVRTCLNLDATWIKFEIFSLYLFLEQMILYRKDINVSKEFRHIKLSYSVKYSLSYTSITVEYIRFS